MKKFLVLSVMLFSSVVSFGQTDVLSVKDAVAIVKGGIEVAKSKLAGLKYKHYEGECGIYECWTKDCDFNCEYEKVTKFGKGTSSVVLVADRGIQVVVFNKNVFQKLKDQIIALGYKKTNVTEGAGTDLSESYTKSNSQTIQAIDESCSRRTNYYYIEIWE